MPSKSRRVAAKQAELGQRKRRAVKHSSGVEASMPAAVAAPPTQTAAPRAEPTTPSPGTATLDRPVRVPQERRPQAPVTRPHSSYIWPEIKRIGIVTGLILAILAVLTVLLR